MELSTDVSDVRSITLEVARASADSHPGRSDDGGDVPIHDQSDSLLSEMQRRIINTVGGERGETLRRTLIRNAQGLERERSHANRTAAAMRLDVKEYLGLLEARFATEFRQVGAELGRRINPRRDSGIRKLRGV